MLTILAGGALGFSLSFGFMLMLRVSDVPADRAVVPPATDESIVRQPVIREYRLQGERDEPIFTPMTVRPEIINRSEVQAAMMRFYPPLLRDAGVGGTVVMWLYISEEGRVLDRRVSESSGRTTLDVAATRVAEVFRFTPAMNRDELAPVWIQIPMTFQMR